MTASHTTAKISARLADFTKSFRAHFAAEIQNPVVLKEMRAAMRGIRPTVLLTIYLIIMGSVVGLVYASFALADDVTTSSNTSQTLGKAIFFTVVSLEMMMVCLLAPALSAGSISAERERQTFDLIRTTLLTARSLVAGKLNSSILFLFMMLLIGFPLQSIAYYLGGVTIEEVLVSFLMLGISAIIFCTIGIIVSSLVKTTLAATVVSYIITVLVLFGAPFLLLLVAMVANVIPSSLNPTPFQEILLQVIGFVIGYIIIAINPLSAAVASEIMLIEQQQLFYTTIDMSYGWKFPVISPWIAYTIFAILVSLALIRLAVYMVRQVEK